MKYLNTSTGFFVGESSDFTYSDERRSWLSAEDAEGVVAEFSDFDGTAYVVSDTKGEPFPIPEPTPEPLPPVPSSVTPRQARLVLALQPSPDTSYPHLLAFVEDAFNSLQEPQKTLAKISWEYATSIERSSDLIAQMQGILGLTSEQIDDLFRQASKL